MLKDIPIKSPELLKILDRWVDIPKMAYGKTMCMSGVQNTTIKNNKKNGLEMNISKS